MNTIYCQPPTPNCQLFNNGVTPVIEPGPALSAHTPAGLRRALFKPINPLQNHCLLPTTNCQLNKGWYPLLSLTQISVNTLAWTSRAEFTHPVIASLDLPSLPQAGKRAKKFFTFSFPTSFRPRRREVDQRSVVG